MPLIFNVFWFFRNSSILSRFIPIALLCHASRPTVSSEYNGARNDIFFRKIIFITTNAKVPG